MTEQTQIYTSMAMHYDSTASMEKVSVLKNILRIPVVLAAEMVQYYNMDELPGWIQKQFPDQKYITVFKPYNELMKSIDGVEKIPFVIPHTKGTFLKELAPFDFDLPNYIQEDEVVGWVKELYADPKSKSIKGMCYITRSKLEDSVAERLERGDLMDVSIGFAAIFAGSGTYEDKYGWKEHYELHQTDIVLGHLAGLPETQGKCSIDKCGLNHDQDPTFLSEIDKAKNKFIADKKLTFNYKTPLSSIAHIHNFVDSNTQPVFEIKKETSSKDESGVFDTPKYEKGIYINNTYLDTKSKYEVDQMTHEEQMALLQDRLKKLEEENSNLKKEITDSKVNELSDSNKTLSQELKLATALIDSQKVTIAEHLKTIQDNAAIVKEINDNKKKEMIEYITSKKLEGYGLADLQDQTICEIKKIHNILKSYESKDADKTLETQGIPKGGTQKQYEDGHKNSGNQAGVSTVMDMNQIAEMRKKQIGGSTK